MRKVRVWSGSIKTVAFGYPTQKYQTLKIEIPGGMIVIHGYLTNEKGEAVQAIHITADRFAGEPGVEVEVGKAYMDSQDVARGVVVRLIEHKDKYRESGD